MDVDRFRGPWLYPSGGNVQTACALDRKVVAQQVLAALPAAGHQCLMSPPDR